MKRVIIIGIGSISLLGIAGVLILINKQNSNYFDYPTRLSNKEETIELMYMAWSCDCAEWARPHDVNLYNDNLNDTLAKLSIFIEAAKPSLQIPEEYKIGCCGNRIRFSGRFYEDNGISRDYEQKTPEKPEPARVFRYTSYQLIKPYTVWDFTAPIVVPIELKQSGNNGL